VSNEHQNQQQPPGREASNLTRLLATTCTVLSETDQKTVALLKNLIANIEAGNVTTLDRSGVQTSDDTAELTLILHGQPDISLCG